MISLGIEKLVKYLCFNSIDDRTVHPAISEIRVRTECVDHAFLKISLVLLDMSSWGINATSAHVPARTESVL